MKKLVCVLILLGVVAVNIAYADLGRFLPRHTRTLESLFCRGSVLDALDRMIDTTFWAG